MQSVLGNCGKEIIVMAEPTLPAQGGSDGTWGTETIAWLRNEHNLYGQHDTIISWESDIVFYEGDILTWQT